MERVTLTRHQIEEAVLEAQHLITAWRGIQGLVGVCEVVLNQTKLCDGLTEKVTKLEEKIASLKQTHDVMVESQRLEYEKQVGEHTAHIQQLQATIKKNKELVEQVREEHRTKRIELEHAHQLASESHAAYMKDIGEKQRVAELNLAALTEQLELIKARFK